MVSLKDITYPSLVLGIERIYPGPENALNTDIIWQIKEDGSNIGIYLDDYNNSWIRLRNIIIANQKMQSVYKNTEESKIIENFLKVMREKGNEYVVFAELCTKGKSPTGAAIHESTHVLAFDIVDRKTGLFINPFDSIDLFENYNIPCVKTIGKCNLMDLKDLYSYRDTILAHARTFGECEGVVGKIMCKPYMIIDEENGTEKERNIIYIKEKFPEYKKSKQRPPRSERPRVEQPPVLWDSEIYGAIAKVDMDLSLEDFENLKIVMPKIVQYVKDECKKHKMSPPSNIIEYYNEYFKNKNEGENI